MDDQTQNPPTRRRWLRRTAIVAAGVVVAGVLGATAAQASPAAGTDSTVTVDTPWRTLAPWASEVIPAATCPADHPYLTKEKYAPDFVTLPPGVEAIVGGLSEPGKLAAVGVSITGWNLVPNPTNPHNSLIVGTKDGPLDSSATNWALDNRSYKLRLHCTNDIAEAATR